MSKAPTVTLTKLAKIDGKWQRYPVAMNKNGTIKPEYILVAGKPEHSPLGNYILDWYEHGKRIRLSVGKEAADALAAKQRKEAELKHVANGGSGLVSGVASATEKTPLKDAIAAFLEKKKLEQRKKTYQAHRTGSRTSNTRATSCSCRMSIPWTWRGSRRCSKTAVWSTRLRGQQASHEGAERA